MRFYVGVTDSDWFSALQTSQATECNFWRPSGQSFKVLEPGQEFLFKLHAPFNVIAGGGTYLRSQKLPLRLAWEVFESSNGVPDFATFARKILGYRAKAAVVESNPEITCIVLEAPVFFHKDDHIPMPTDWANNIVSGKTHDTANPLHDALFQRYMALRHQYRGQHTSPAMRMVAEQPAKYGAAYLTQPRVGQAAFRLQVLAAYAERCAITNEHMPMVLEAAHIQPYADAGVHALANALLLRADFHRLFDAGYIGVDADYRVQISPRIASETANGIRYQARAGQRIHLPADQAAWPDPALLTWHQQRVFLAG